jgi:hypothetical protein
MSSLFTQKTVTKKVNNTLMHLIYMVFIKIKAEASKARKLLGAILALKKATITNPETLL